MQSILECTVCTCSYHHTKRIPKTLACGHVFCAQCLWTLLTRCAVKCPKCRALTTVPVLDVSNLPTSFTTIEYLESACDECLYHPWRSKCHHCSQNLCESCLLSHRESLAVPAASIRELDGLKSRMASLQNVIDNDNSIADISSNGDDVLRTVDKAHRERIAVLMDHQEQSVHQVQSHVKQMVERHLKWREESARVLVEASIFHDRCTSLKKVAPICTDELGDLSSKCGKQACLLEKAVNSRPALDHIRYVYPPVEIESLLSGCGSLHFMDAHEIAPLNASTEHNEHVPVLYEDPENKWPSHSNESFKSEPLWDLDGVEHKCTRTDDDAVKLEKHIQCNQNVFETSLSSFQSVKINIDYSSFVIKNIVGKKGRAIGEFNGPRGVCLSPKSGHYFVTDCNNHRVQKLNSDLEAVETFGRAGRGYEELMNPSGIGVTANGNIFIVDSNNHRVQVIDETGKFLYTVGSMGSDPGEFCYPEGLAVHRTGRVFVSDMLNNRIQVIEPGGRSAGVLGCPTYISHPGVIAASDTDQLLVGDDKGHLLLLNLDGGLIKNISSLADSKLSGAVFDGSGNIVTSDRSGCVVVLSVDGEIICRFGQPGSESGEFCDPHGIVLTVDGQLVVCDTENHRLQSFGQLAYKGTLPDHCSRETIRRK